METYKASKTPQEDILRVTYDGQDPKRRMYRSGYELYFNELPKFSADDPMVEEKTTLSGNVIKALANNLVKTQWIHENDPGEGGFSRTILAIESPYIDGEAESEGSDNFKIKEGVELIVAQWGNNFSSPVHGHALGLLHEEILFGKIRVNTYRMIDPKKNIVRTISTVIAGQGTLISTYTHPGKYYFKRQGYIHNFTSIGFSASLHYVPEHTRDGRDNGFEVEYFEDTFDLGVEDLKRITSYEGMYLQKGEVCLVRSTNVPEYGDHYIVITGAPVLKEHGLRPQDVAIGAPHTKELLDKYTPVTGLILFKLGRRAQRAFHDFHGITMKNNEIVFPTPTPLTF